MARRNDSHRLIRWLWNSRRIDARLARAGLLPVAAVWRAGMAVREAGYRHGWLETRSLPLPSVVVGNLTVGGTGKTPVASWIARHYVRRGVVPGILLRGYGGDEVLVHRQAVPEARVVANPDRPAGARQAALEGAQVLVLDDAYQRLDVRRDCNLAVVSVEAAVAARWPLPAGPWREGWRALDRADAVIVTRKRVAAERAAAHAAELRRRVSVPVAVAHLRLGRFEGLLSAAPVPAAVLRGARVVAASGVGDPDAFVGQLEALGAAVRPATWRDHHAYDAADLAWLADAARGADYVVTTQKDAVKWRGRWPEGAPEPVVAMLDLEWEAGGERVVAALDAIVRPSAISTHEPSTGTVKTTL